MSLDTQAFVSSLINQLSRFENVAIGCNFEGEPTVVYPRESTSGFATFVKASQYRAIAKASSPALKQLFIVHDDRSSVELCDATSIRIVNNFTSASPEIINSGSALLIRDEAVLVVWSDATHRIGSLLEEIEHRLQDAVLVASSQTSAQESKAPDVDSLLYLDVDTSAADRAWTDDFSACADLAGLPNSSSHLGLPLEYPDAAVFSFSFVPPAARGTGHRGVMLPELRVESADALPHKSYSVPARTPHILPLNATPSSSYFLSPVLSHLALSRMPPPGSPTSDVSAPTISPLLLLSPTASSPTPSLYPFSPFSGHHTPHSDWMSPLSSVADTDIHASFASVLAPPETKMFGDPTLVPMGATVASLHPNALRFSPVPSRQHLFRGFKAKAMFFAEALQRATAVSSSSSGQVHYSPGRPTLYSRRNERAVGLWTASFSPPSPAYPDQISREWAFIMSAVEANDDDSKDDDYVPDDESDVADYEESARTTKKARTSAGADNSRKRRWTCCKCWATFGRQYDLRRHEERTCPYGEGRAHSRAQNICPNCESTFSRADALRRHAKICG
ncbi:hypothetical protein FOMPIDRAFT_1050497 [Fomitopsis schrenkii]|uniref:DUF7928 domain-containing protein n=1 Tax=Fomitopsis schrenkii TaxID=2126942 RepID=S8E2R4_FOMSC|nr:hypothetical protein FOMPIDRAFT_1050497 [Fomitopsis schrenkii]